MVPMVVANKWNKIIGQYLNNLSVRSF